jgi:hypothetical protein
LSAVAAELEPAVRQALRECPAPEALEALVVQAPEVFRGHRELLELLVHSAPAARVAPAAPAVQASAGTVARVEPEERVALP